MHNRKIRFLAFIILLLGLFSCSSENRRVEEKPETHNLINLLDCELEDYPYVIENLMDNLPIMYPNCSEFKLSFQEITDDEKYDMIKSMEIIRTSYLSDYPDKDSTIWCQQYVFSKLDFCGPTIPYVETDTCAFYAGVVYHTTDRQIQFIRLFQKDCDEFMDLILDVSGEKPDVIAFG